MHHMLNDPLPILELTSMIYSDFMQCAMIVASDRDERAFFIFNELTRCANLI